jgi:hypothetical protein
MSSNGKKNLRFKVTKAIPGFRVYNMESENMEEKDIPDGFIFTAVNGGEGKIPESIDFFKHAGRIWDAFCDIDGTTYKVQITEKNLRPTFDFGYEQQLFRILLPNEDVRNGWGGDTPSQGIPLSMPQFGGSRKGRKNKSTRRKSRRNKK